MARQKPKIFTVTQVNSLIKVAIEDNLPSRMTVSGEISDWKVHHSGHCYFSIKDANSTLPCVMWKSSFSRVKFEPENGMAVLATGYIDVYPPQGKYQFYAERFEPAGVGALQLAFEQMVRRLKAEGLFDDIHKKPLPRYPRRIGIFTSPTGAAIDDITDSIRNRWPCAKLLLYPVLVQGDGAAQEIAAALRDVNRRNSELKLDVLIVGRGGGSMEDLWQFNEEVLARAIFDSEIPVISAVGHEVDVTISDFVADARASTPTKAGVTAVPDIVDVLANLENLQRRLEFNLNSRIELAGQNLEILLASAVFRNPLLPVYNVRQRLDELSTDMFDLVGGLIRRAREKLYSDHEQISKIEPHRLVGQKRVELNSRGNALETAIRVVVHDRKLQLSKQQNSLRAMNPKSVLSRGYSLTTNAVTGKVVTCPDDIEVGQMMTTELAGENLIESQVKIKHNKAQ